MEKDIVSVSCMLDKKCEMQKEKKLEWLAFKECETFTCHLLTLLLCMNPLL